MLYESMRAVVPPVARVIWRPVVDGLENVPDEGPVILASNHLSFADSVVIPVVAPRRVVFLAKEEYFTRPGVRGRLARSWYTALGAVPVNRDDTRSALGSLNTALEILRQGDALGLYPEGTRSRDGRLYRGRTGVAQLALMSGAPIVPVGLIGTDRLQPVGSRLPRLARIEVRFGAPIHPGDEYDGMAPGRARRDLTDRVMATIQELSGQEAAGVYNERPADG